MKKFVLLAIFGLICVVQSNVFAYTRSMPLTSLDRIVGNWYDSKGNLVLTISEDYKINGYKVIEIHSNGEYRPLFFGDCVDTVRISKGNVTRDINLESCVGRILVLDGEISLRNTKDPNYFESIGGIYLGMGKNQVTALYGNPSKIDYNTRGFRGHESWIYDKENFRLEFAGDAVCLIEIYSSSDINLDWSGLSSGNSKSDFEHKYNSKFMIYNSSISIGNGEKIFLDEIRRRLYLCYMLP